MALAEENSAALDFMYIVVVGNPLKAGTPLTRLKAGDAQGFKGFNDQYLPRRVIILNQSDHSLEITTTPSRRKKVQILIDQSESRKASLEFLTYLRGIN